MASGKTGKSATKKTPKPALAAVSTTNVLERVRGAQQVVAVGKAGGRPMLNWIGKRAPATVQAFPAQWVETYGDEAPNNTVWKDWPDGLRRGGLLYHGDNKEVLAHLLANGFRGQVKLIYIDPPFDSGADYVRKVELRGPKVKVKLGGEGYTLGEQIQYTDIWANDQYLQFMYERLLLLKELMHTESIIILHCDWKKSHHLRCLMDEVFGSQNFQNEIYWYFYNKMHDDRKGILPRATNTLLVYGLGSAQKLHKLAIPRENVVKQLKRVKVDGVLENLKDENGNLVYQDSDSKTLDNVWGIPLIPPADYKQKTDYPTQKPEALLELALYAYTNPGELVLDAFIGSGTTGVAAQRLGRRWIGCDINKGAIQTTVKRLQRIMETQASEGHKPAQGKLLAEGEAPVPAQLGFTHWRVNDYDLAIQHNEAAALACEYLGVERLRTDSFFDGVLGKQLVKIIPFGHPLSPADLEVIRTELDARPEEDRAITVVCLGKELAADKWLSDWNRLRKKKTDPHHIEVIELRSDPKYGGFLQHEPAQARVAMKRINGKLHIEIEDFVSPGIVARLAQQSGVVQPKIADWRSMVDSVMIDPAYDGVVFNVRLADVPERRADVVEGQYELPEPESGATVAVKITDMLGEEVLITQIV
jgi:DNA modification methylase